ncbi:hypothetical protein P7K49_029380, partial [Saguinus oedipus]
QAAMDAPRRISGCVQLTWDFGQSYNVLSVALLDQEAPHAPYWPQVQGSPDQCILILIGDAE